LVKSPLNSYSDGKHLRIKKPSGAGSQFWNYKQFHSIVLMAVADARYRFIFCDIGAYGVNNDSYVFNTCAFSNGVEEDLFSIPGSSRLPNSDIDFPFFFVADDAFASRSWLLKPLKGNYLTDKQHEYNYRYEVPLY
jgi:hypothetical protein